MCRDLIVTQVLHYRQVKKAVRGWQIGDIRRKLLAGKQGIAVATEKEVALAQGRLAESVVEQAKKLAIRLDYTTWLVLGLLMLAVLLLYSALLLWAGYCLGSGQTQPPALLLRMPVGVIAGALCAACGMFLGARAAKDYAEEHKQWRRRILAALGCLLPGGWILSAFL